MTKSEAVEGLRVVGGLLGWQRALKVVGLAVLWNMAGRGPLPSGPDAPAGWPSAVTLWRLLPHDRRFHEAVRVRTDSDGRYSATLTRVNTNTRWYATARGTKSRTVSVAVHVRIAPIRA